MLANQCPECAGTGLTMIESPRKLNDNVVLIKMKCHNCKITWDNVYAFEGVKGITHPPKNFLFKAEHMLMGDERVCIEIYENVGVGKLPKLLIRDEHIPSHGYPTLERVAKLIGDVYGYTVDGEKVIEPGITLFQIGDYEDGKI